MKTVREQIIARHFAAKTIRALKKKGIVVMGTTFIPGKSGTYLDGETAYNIDDNGTGRVKTFLEVLALA